MKRRIFVLVGGTVLLAACSQSTDKSVSNDAASNTVQPPKKSAFCFFKDEEMKGWKASREPNGDIRVEGKAHVKDPRYKAAVGQWAVGPKKVIIFPTITTNDTGYATPDNWWDLSVVVPKTASLTEAEVQCGDNSVADLQIAAKG